MLKRQEQGKNTFSYDSDNATVHVFLNINRDYTYVLTRPVQVLILGSRCNREFLYWESAQP